MATSAEKLAEARSSLHAAVGAADDPEHRRQHVHHAATLAADVALSAESTTGEKTTAGEYLDQAAGMERQAERDCRPS